jgi:KDO2-lipid IV(A) lauroyltransferase
MSKACRYFFEFLIVRSLFFLFSLLPLTMASKLGGYLFQAIGPRLGLSKTSIRNLQKILSLSALEAQQFTKEVWKNLGQNAGEFMHISRLHTDQFLELIEVRGKENLEFLNKGGFLFTAHIGNWEILPRFIKQNNLEMALVYRAANNEAVDKIIVNERLKFSNTIPKGKNGIKNMLEFLNAQKVVGMLVDQKMNDGIEVPFFNKPAMTAPAIAKLALKFNLPIIPIRVIRKPNSKFIIEVSKPLDIRNGGIYEVMVEVNQIIENWIREYPTQWLWVHRRWKNLWS